MSDVNDNARSDKLPGVFAGNYQHAWRGVLSDDLPTDDAYWTPERLAEAIRVPDALCGQELLEALRVRDHALAVRHRQQKTVAVLTATRDDLSRSDIVFDILPRHSEGHSGGHSGAGDERADAAALAEMVSTPTAPLPWRAVPESQRPSGPLAEYYASPVDIPAEEMMRRWEGLGRSLEIEQLYRTPYLERNVQRLRTVREMRMAAPPNIASPARRDALRPEAVRARQEQVYGQLQEIEDIEAFLLTARQEPMVGRRVDENGNITYAEQWVAMSGRHAAYHASVLRTVREEQREIEDRAAAADPDGQISLTEQKRQRAARELDEWRRQQNINLTVTVQNTIQNNTVQVNPPAEPPASLLTEPPPMESPPNGRTFEQ